MQEPDFAEKFLRVYQAGEVVFEEGGDGRQMYVVNSGQVDVFRRSEGRQVRIGTLGPGEVFGEMALVDDLPRSATVVAAEENTRLLEIDHALFIYLVGQQPTFALMILKAISLRLRTQYEHYGISSQHLRDPSECFSDPSPSPLPRGGGEDTGEGALGCGRSPRYAAVDPTGQKADAAG